MSNVTAKRTNSQQHVRKLIEARSLLIDIKADPQGSYHPDSDIGKALEAAELSIELAWSLIEAKS